MFLCILYFCTIKKEAGEIVDKKDFTEEAITVAAKLFYEEHGKWPTTKTKEPVPGMPHETWKIINAAGYEGYRGLTKGRTLAVILKPIKTK